MKEKQTWISAEAGMKPVVDIEGSETTFLSLSSWTTLKDMKWGTAEALLEKDHCIPGPLANPTNPQR